MLESAPFVWTPDQLQRYAFLRETVAALGFDRPVRLLDVGGAAPNRDGSLGWLPASEIFRGLGVTAGSISVLDRAAFSTPGYVRGDGLRLPFPDGAFDVVSAMDVLEHIPGPDRPVFLREMTRVASRLVVLSGPRRNEAVVEAERRVADEIKKRYHIEHVQLAEHAAFGLISDSETRDALESGGAAVASLGFGSLASWTYAQELRARYLLRRKSPQVLEKLDAFLSSRDVRLEFEPPFYRMFWLASKIRTKEDLDDLGETVRARLLAAPEFVGEDREERFQKFAAAAAAMESEAIVSALVVSRGGGDALCKCLRHLLTQEIDFDLEIAVWDAGGGEGRAREAAGEFPQVRFLGDGLLRAASGLRGEAILLIDESVSLPPTAVSKLHAAWRSDPGPGVWAWRAPWKRYLSWTRAGRRWTHAAAGRIPGVRRGPEILAKRAGGWIYGRCLIASRELFTARRPSGRRSGMRSLFLWE